MFLQEHNHSELADKELEDLVSRLIYHTYLLHLAKHSSAMP